MIDRRERQDDPVEAQRAALDGRQAEIWTALPGIIQSFDPVAMTVTVQPAVAGRVTDETGKTSSVNMPLLPDVPVVFPGGGGFTLTFPVASGDECLVVFASRCIDAWWQSGGIGEPMEPRMHDLSDGFALVGVRSQARRLSPAVDSENVQIRSDDGKTFVEMTPGGDVNAVGPTSVTLKSEGSITLDAPQIIIKGLLSMQSQSGGATTATLDGSLNATGDVTASNISLNSHTHPGDSGGTTGGPQ